MKILLIRFSSIGDITLTTPLIRSLKEKYSDAQIDYLVHEEYHPLLKDNPFLNKIYCHKRNSGLTETIKNALSLRDTKYDFIFDLHRSLRSKIYTLFIKGKHKRTFKKYYFRRFLLVYFKINLYRKILSVAERYFQTAEDLHPEFSRKPEIWAVNSEIYRSLKKINEISKININIKKLNKNIINISKDIFSNKNKIVAFMPFAKWFTKEWGDEKFIELGKLIYKKTGAKTIILGGKNDEKRAAIIAKGIGNDAILCAGKLDLIQNAVMLSASKALVTNDTGIMHIGNAVSVPVIALFGSTVEELGFFPYGANTQAIQTELDCRPCTSKGLPRCPKEHFNCMNKISVKSVLKAVLEYI